MISTDNNKRTRSDTCTSSNSTNNSSSTNKSGSDNESNKRQAVEDDKDDETTPTEKLWKAITLTSLDMKALYQYIKSKGDLDIFNEDGYSLVYLAARNDSMEALRLLLLTSDLKVNHVNGPHQEVALHAAASTGSFDALELLLENGSDVNCCDTLGHTPLSNTLFAKALPCTEMLIKAGAILDTIDQQGNTLLHLAVSNHFTEAIALLIDKGVEVDQVNQRGLSPLAIAIGLGYYDVVTALLTGGADVNGKTRYGTVLHHAVTWNRMPALELLVEGGADLNGLNAMDETPLLVAVQQRKIDIVRYLIDKGADPCYQKDGNTGTNAPLLYAANHGYTELCHLLATEATSSYFMQMAADMSERASWPVTAKSLQSKIQERHLQHQQQQKQQQQQHQEEQQQDQQQQQQQEEGNTTTSAITNGLSSVASQSSRSLGLDDGETIFDTDFSSLINTFSDDDEDNIEGNNTSSTANNASTSTPLS